jgi:hypothetical protein
MVGKINKKMVKAMGNCYFSVFLFAGCACTTSQGGRTSTA